MAYFPQTSNLTFTASKTFWTRFINGDIDISDFKDTIEKFVHNGKADWSYTDENGNTRSTPIFGKYMNIFVNPKSMMNLSGGNFASMEKERITRDLYNLSNWFGKNEEFIEYFYFLHPSEAGKKSFWRDGEYKSIEEILEFWEKEDKDKFHPKDDAERAAEKYYKDYPENRGKKLFYYEGNMYTYEENYRLTVKSGSAIPDTQLPTSYWNVLDKYR